MHQRVRGNGNQVAGNNIINLGNRPYIDPNHSRDCPHCGSVNKRFAELCWVCDFPMTAWDEQELTKERVRKASGYLAIGVAILITSVLSLAGPWVWLGYIAALCFAAYAQRLVSRP